MQCKAADGMPHFKESEKYILDPRQVVKFEEWTGQTHGTQYILLNAGWFSASTSASAASLEFDDC